MENVVETLRAEEVRFAGLVGCESLTDANVDPAVSTEQLPQQSEPSNQGVSSLLISNEIMMKVHSGSNPAGTSPTYVAERICVYNLDTGQSEGCPYSGTSGTWNWTADVNGDPATISLDQDKHYLIWERGSITDPQGEPDGR